MWIDGGQDNPEDLCVHGDVTILVGDDTLHDSCCASASAMRMLRTLSEDHTVEDSMHGQQMLPCCGHSMFPDSSLENVYISGCCGGIDYAVRHEENSVVIVTEGENQNTVRFEDYRREVLQFARQVEAFYNQCSPKKLPDDDFHRNGYIAFWNEWKRRMLEEEKHMQTL
jgi:hypothetical protein